jgi:uncharacterized protein YkwD
LVAPLLGATILASANLAVAGPAAAAYTPDSYEVLMADAINAYRKSNGLTAIPLSPATSMWAHWRSADQCKRQYFSHTIPAFGEWSGDGNLLAYWRWEPHWFKTTSRFSEIIARNGLDTRWVTGLLSQWKESSLHNSMLLAFSGKYDRMGVGLYRCPNGKKYGTVVFLNLP